MLSRLFPSSLPQAVVVLPHLGFLPWLVAEEQDRAWPTKLTKLFCFRIRSRLGSVNILETVPSKDNVVLVSSQQCKLHVGRPSLQIPSTSTAGLLSFPICPPKVSAPVCLPGSQASCLNLLLILSSVSPLQVDSPQS